MVKKKNKNEYLAEGKGIKVSDLFTYESSGYYIHTETHTHTYTFIISYAGVDT